MQRISTLLLAGACAVALIRLASAQAAPEMSLTRLDCGTSAAPTAVNQRFSDTYAYGDLKLQFVFSCYLTSTATNTCVGCRPCHDHSQRCAEGEPGRSAGADQRQA